MSDAKGSVRRIAVSGPLMTDDAEVLVGAATAGLGIMLATDWLVGPGLQAGSLAQAGCRSDVGIRG
jgi:DNA-binding transcriptional LysR family regulator